MDTFQVPDGQPRERLDKYVTALLEESRSTVQHMIKEGYILVNEQPSKARYIVLPGDVISVEPLPEVEINLEPQNIPLDIVYQDQDVIVINKQKGLVVHPGAGHYTGTLVNALLYHIKDFHAIKGEIRPGIVHRIDKDTTGLLVVAKTPEALTHLSNQLKNKTAKRVYVALVDGVIPHNLGKIDAPIGRDPKYRQRMAVVDGGKDAVTHFSVLKRYPEHTLIECRLETGRTHQIRVHLNYIQYPIVGDPTYGRKKTDVTNSQFLHAKSLTFVHPRTNQEMTFETELPDFFNTLLEELT